MRYPKGTEYLKLNSPLTKIARGSQELLSPGPCELACDICPAECVPAERSATSTEVACPLSAVTVKANWSFTSLSEVTSLV